MEMNSHQFRVYLEAIRKQTIVINGVSKSCCDIGGSLCCWNHRIIAATGKVLGKQPQILRLQHGI